MTSEVNVYVQERIQPQHHDVVNYVRRLMRECAPQAGEIVSYGMITWNIGYPIAWLNPAKTHLTFSFREGVNFIDNYRLLKGSGKTARGVQLKSIEGVNQEALREYIRQAVERA